MRIKIVAGLLIAVGFLAVAAQPAAALDTEVDVELALLIDLSGSISGSEFNLQINGYEAAFDSTAVQNAIDAAGGGTGGSVAVGMFGWTWDTSDGSLVWIELVSWQEVTKTTAGNFADTIGALEDATPGSVNDYAAGVTGAYTPVQSALAAGGDEFAGNGFAADRQVIDISGDGARNAGLTGTNGRDAAVADGVDTINGLVIETGGVASYYNTYVKYGTNSFVLAIDDFDDFATAIEDKLTADITGTVVPLPASAWLGLGLLGVLGVGRRIRRRKQI